MKSNKLMFFLGGADAEMTRIREILTDMEVPFVDRGLEWGAKVSDYGADQLAEAAGEGFTPVLVELEIDCAVPEGTVDINHHNERASEPASILQVLKLLDCEPTRWDLVVAADDVGWFPGLQAIGATAQEMLSVREAGRKAQGITAEQEDEAERALDASIEKVGDIRVVRMAHSRTAPVGDAIAIEAITAGEPIPSYVVFSEGGEVNFSGRGDIALALHEKFAGGWAGGHGLGDIAGTAYWGGYPSHDEVLEFLRSFN